MLKVRDGGNNGPFKRMRRVGWTAKDGGGFPSDGGGTQAGVGVATSRARRTRPELGTKAVSIP